MQNRQSVSVCMEGEEMLMVLLPQGVGICFCLFMFSSRRKKVGKKNSEPLLSSCYMRMPLPHRVGVVGFHEPTCLIRYFIHVAVLLFVSAADIKREPGHHSSLKWRQRTSGEARGPCQISESVVLDKITPL